MLELNQILSYDEEGDGVAAIMELLEGGELPVSRSNLLQAHYFPRLRSFQPQISPGDYLFTSRLWSLFYEGYRDFQTIAATKTKSQVSQTSGSP